MKPTLLIIILAGYFSFSPEKMDAQLLSSTTTQVGYNSIYPGTVNEIILRIEVEVGATQVTLSEMTFNLNGSTLPFNDIINAKLWQYNDSATLSTTFGTLLATYNSPGGSSFSFFTAPNPNYSGPASYNGMTLLKKNYFWLTFDISPGAILCDTVDAEFTEFQADGAIQFPAISAPAGFRVVGICPTGLGEILFHNPEVNAFPQPCRDDLTISFNSIHSEFINMELYNMNGQLAATLFKGMTTGQIMELNFSLAQLPPGIYYLNAIFDEKVVTKKIIKM